VRRLGVIADAHGNLPATRAALDALQDAGCTDVFHLGDAVGMGPHPAEVVGLLIARGVRCLMGNHDELLVHGLPEPTPPWMSAGEVAHHRWVHGQPAAAQRDAMRRWPYAERVDLGVATVALVHYARTPAGAFERVVRRAPEELARLYAGVAGDVVVFGHDHLPCDVASGGRRFLNPGSLGCHDRAVARALILEPDDPEVRILRLALPYDDSALLRDLERRRVPDRALILRTFIRRSQAGDEHADPQESPCPYLKSATPSASSSAGSSSS
jgi:putative phosphoesterase